MRYLVKLGLSCLASMGLSLSAHAQANSQWPSAGQNINNTRNAKTEARISPDNVGRLQVRWAFANGADISATPAVDAQRVYVPDWGGKIYAIDARTGAEVWHREVKDLTGQTFNLSRTTPLILNDKIIIGTQLGDPIGVGARVIALDKETGQTIWVTQVDDFLGSVITQSAVAHGNVIYVGVSSMEEVFAADPTYPCCSFRGSVVALNKDTGAMLWKTYMSPGGIGFSGNAVWGSTPVVDPARGSVYVTTGNNYSVPDEVLDCVAAGGIPSTIKACVDTVPGSADNLFDAIVAIDMKTGAIKWSRSALPFDAWNYACVVGGGDNCPDPAGYGYDFGQGPALFTVNKGQDRTELLGAGQKSGIYWTLNPDNGNIVWLTQVGPGGQFGGLQWGSATDGERIYTAVSNSNFEESILSPGPANGRVVKGGFWAALSAGTGEILWQNAGTNGPAFYGPTTPADAIATNQGPVTVANGVVFAGAMDAEGTMYALDAASGEILWSFESGGSVNSGAAVVNGTVYWGSGYSNLGLGTPNNRLFAFEVGLGKNGYDNTLQSESVPDNFVLAQNYPNPFNETTIIKFSLPDAGPVTLRVYSLAGQLIRTITSEELDAGMHEAQWDATNDSGTVVPSGVYLYRLTTPNGSRTGKLTLSK